MREREKKIKVAKTEQEREAAKQDKAFFRLSLVFHGEGERSHASSLELVKQVLGKGELSACDGSLAQKVVAMCRGK